MGADMGMDSPMGNEGLSCSDLLNLSNFILGQVGKSGGTPALLAKLHPLPTSLFGILFGRR